MGERKQLDFVEVAQEAQALIEVTLIDVGAGSSDSTVELETFNFSFEESTEIEHIEASRVNFTLGEGIRLIDFAIRCVSRGLSRQGAVNDAVEEPTVDE